MIERTVTVRLHEVVVSFNVSETEAAQAVNQFINWREVVKSGKHTITEVFATLVDAALTESDEMGGAEIEDLRISVDGEDLPTVATEDQ